MGFDLGKALSSAVKSVAKAASNAGAAVAGEVSDAEHAASGAVATAAKAANAVAAQAQKDASDALKTAKDLADKAASAAKDAAKAVGKEVSHLGKSFGDAFTDVVHDVEGAIDTLKTLVQGLTPAKLVAEIEKDLSTFQQVFDGMLGLKGADSISLSTITIPRGGPVASIFPSKYRGETVTWVEARQNAGTLLWYLAALALVEPLRLRDLFFKFLGDDFKKVAKLFGIKSFDDKGLEPISSIIVANLPVIIPVALAVLTAAAAIIAAVSGPKTIAHKIAVAAKEQMGGPPPPGMQYDDNGNLVPIPPAPVVVGPPPITPLEPLGHSSDAVTYAVIALLFGVGIVLVYVISKPKRRAAAP